MFGVLHNVYLPIIFDWVIETSIMASILVGLILCLKMLLKNQLTPRWQYALWLILLVRLMLPWSPNSSFSMYSMLLQGYENLSNPMQEQTLKAENEVKEEVIFQDEGKSSGHLSIYEILMYVWLLGVLCLSSSTIIVNRRLHIYLHKQPVITNDRVLRIFESCKEQMSIERDISLLLAGKISSPALQGYVRPRILICEKHVTQLDDKQLRFIFYHELAHFKRKDVGVNWIMYSLLLINWFNPILWYAYYAMREDQEIACDELALTFIGYKEKLAYGHTIITLLEHFPKYNQTPSLKNLSSNKYALKRRILMIKKFNKKSYRWSILGIATVVGLSIFSLTNAKTAENSNKNEHKVENREANGNQDINKPKRFLFMLEEAQIKSLKDRGLPTKQTREEAKSTGLILVHSRFDNREEAPGFWISASGEVDVIKKEEYPTKYGIRSYAFTEEW
ncbi:M56 family metallopeptidase [Bacillus sp. 'calajunan']|uniref:M56 family metallopeptidase n=1 Tax=Bacillus sp. 'calajunan' TaxID=3447457 RepID=UPI003EDF3A9D